MKLLIKKGTKQKRIIIFVGSKGFGITGLSANSLVCYRYRNDDGNKDGVRLPLHDGTRGAWSSGGFVEKDPVNMPGVYELGLDNAGLAPGSDAVVYLLHTDKTASIYVEIQLIDFVFITRKGKESKKQPKPGKKKKKKPKKKMSLKMMMKAHKKKKKPKKKMSLKMMMKAHKKKKKPKKKMSLKMMMKAHKKMSKTRPGQKPDTGPMSKVKPLPKKKKPTSKKRRRMSGQKPDTHPKHRKSKMSKKMSKSKMSKSKMSKSKMSKKMSKSKMSKSKMSKKMSKKPKMLMQMKQMMMMSPSPSPSPSPDQVGAGWGFPGVVYSGGPGNNYQVDIWTNGMDNPSTRVNCTQVVIPNDETIPTGTGCLVVKAGNGYYMQVKSPSGMPGEVVSGSGDTYQVTVWPWGKGDGMTEKTVQVTQLQIDSSSTIPAGTAVLVIKNHTSYYMQVPIWAAEV